jgi:hypothetical protein
MKTLVISLAVTAHSTQWRDEMLNRRANPPPTLKR